MLLLPETIPSLTVSTKIRLRGQSVRCGGQTATTLATCAALGLKAKYVGVIGRDEEGWRIRDALARRGVGAAHIIERDVPTQTATILVHVDTGTRIVLSDRDPRLALRPERRADRGAAGRAARARGRRGRGGGDRGGVGRAGRRRAGDQ